MQEIAFLKSSSLKDNTVLSKQNRKRMEKFQTSIPEEASSDREGIRVVIELKRDAMSEIVLNHLFKSTTMESTFGIILLAINNKEPKIFNLLELLQIFIAHRKTIIIRSSREPLNVLAVDEDALTLPVARCPVSRNFRHSDVTSLFFV